MKTAFDLVCTNKSSGSLTYILNLLKCIKKNYSSKKIYIFINKNIYYSNYQLINSCKNLNVIKVSEIYTLSYFKIIWVQLILPLYLKLFKINKLLSPLNISPIINKFLDVKTILVLHSNLPWTHFDLMPGNLLKKKLIKYFMEKSLETCDKIVCVSQYSKKELKKIFKKKIIKKIECLHLSLSEDYYQKKK